MVPGTDLVCHGLDEHVLDAFPLTANLIPLHTLVHGISLTGLLHVLLLCLEAVGDHSLGRTACELLVLAADSVHCLLL